MSFEQHFTTQDLTWLLQQRNTNICRLLLDKLKHYDKELAKFVVDNRLDRDNYLETRGKHLMIVEILETFQEPMK